jgi:hypothetical protein
MGLGLYKAAENRIRTDNKTSAQVVSALKSSADPPETKGRIFGDQFANHFSF